jgi:hypothetical protein
LMSQTSSHPTATGGRRQGASESAPEGMDFSEEVSVLASPFLRGYQAQLPSFSSHRRNMPAHEPVR